MQVDDDTILKVSNESTDRYSRCGAITMPGGATNDVLLSKKWMNNLPTEINSTLSNAKFKVMSTQDGLIGNLIVLYVASGVKNNYCNY